MPATLAILDGDVMDVAQAQIPVIDDGLLRGDEALLVSPHGRILEGPTTSFFYVLDGALYTPPLSDRILDSITRRALMAVTPAAERVTTQEDLAAASEAFLASSLREVH